MQPLIDLKNVSVIYNEGQDNESRALQDVSLEIYEGEYIVFFGPSGCGKSTLLYTIAGLETPTQGEITVSGHNLKNISSGDSIEFYRTTIGMVFQAFYLVPHLTAKDNMMLSKMFSGVPVAEREARANELCDRFGITSFAHHKPSTMSGGQQQRTAIARALMNNPTIVLADEPVGNLDSKNAEVVLELLADIHQKEKKTVIQVTHNAKDIHYADRVFYMKDGRVERVVVQKQRSVDKPVTEFDKLSKAYPHDDQAQVRARLIMRSLLMPYDIDTEERMVSAIESYLKGAFTEQELLHFFDDEKDGARLNAQKARSLTQSVVKLAEEMRRASDVANASLEERVSFVLSQLTDSYSGTLSNEQKSRLSGVLEKRLQGEASHEEFELFLDRPLSEGGVGLNSHTARNFAETVRVMLT